MKNVLLPNPLTISQFLEIITGEYYILRDDDDFVTAHNVLQRKGIEDDENPLWDYPLDEIDHVVENDLRVVLVEGMTTDEDDKLVNTYRWFEVPNGYEEKFTTQGGV